VTIAFANVGALYEEDILDAAEYLRLPLIHTYFKWYEPRELFAAYAGHGMGICSPEVTHDKTRCEAELYGFPRRDVFFLEYTKEALLIQVRQINASIDYGEDFWNSHVSEASFDLGSSAREKAGYSDEVASFIRSYLDRALRYRRDLQEMTVMVTGDADVKSMALMESAVRAVVAGERGAAVHLLTLQPVYTTARGAAEMEWHALALQNSTLV
jgi:hypothetical protein